MSEMIIQNVTFWVRTYHGQMFSQYAVVCPKHIADSLGLKDGQTINSNQVFQISKKMFEWVSSLAQRSEQ